MKFFKKIFAKKSQKSSEKEKDLKILCLKQQQELIKVREEMKILQEKYNQVNQRVFKANAPQRRRTFPENKEISHTITRATIFNSDPVNISSKSLWFSNQDFYLQIFKNQNKEEIR